MASAARRGVEVEGAPQLRRAFKKLGDDAGDLKPIHEDVSKVVERRADELVPRKSGRLARSIRGRATKTRARIEAGRGLPYEGPIHFGWRARNIEPQPFLYDATDQRRDEVLRRYDKGVDEMVRKWDRIAP